ncbi:MAG: MbnP family protein [Ferruginibacter sp.]
MNTKNFLYISLFTALFATSCKKDDAPAYDSNVKADLSVEFDNVVGAADLALNTGSYTNAAGESFTVTKLKYYVSNFVLTRTDGTVYTVPQKDCYFLVDESDESTHEPILSVPEGEYATISFLVGVDSLRSTMDISQRTGNLDPAGVASDMYWTWNSGYIFFKMEGTSPASTMMGEYMYHIGGFGGMTSSTINNIKKVTLDLTARGVPQVKSGKSTNIHLMVDVLKMFNGSSNVSIAANPMVMFDPYSTTIANNYSAMFRHDHTEN